MNQTSFKNSQYISPVPNWARYLLLGVILVLPVILYVAVQFVSGIQVVGFVFLLGVAIISLISFPTGLISLIVFLPFEPFLLQSIPTEFILFFRLVPETIIGSLFIKGFWERYGAQSFNSETEDSILQPIDNPIKYILPLFTTLALISIVVNRVGLLPAAVGMRQLLRFILLYLAVLFYGLNRKQIIIVIGLVAIIAGFESIVGVTQALIGAPMDTFLSTGREVFLGNVRISQDIYQVRGEGRRVFATMGRYDHLGTFLALISTTALGFIYQAKHKYKRIASYLLLLTIPVLVLTYSRASWFGFVLGLVVASVLIKKDKKVLMVLLVLIASIVGYTAYKEIRVRRLIDEPRITPMQRLLEAFSERRWRSEYQDKGRMFFIVETPRALFPSHIFLGVGPGQYGGGAATLLHNTTAYDELGLPFGIWSVEGQVDSNWTSMLGETGVLGIAAYVGMFISFLFFARRVLKDPESSDLSKSLSLGFIAATLSYTFQGFLGTHFEVRTLAPFYWLLAAIAVTSYHLDKKDGLYKDENFAD